MPRAPQAMIFAAALAFVVRLAALATFAGSPFTQVMIGDSKGYLATAAKIGSGDLGVFFQSAPLYPFLLAFCRILTDDVWLPAVLLQIVLTSLACAAIAASAAVVFPQVRSAPWIAGIAAAVYGPSIYFDLDLLPASLASSLLAFAMILALRGAGHARSMLAGLLVGAAALLAPALVLVAAALAVSTALGAGRRPERASLVRGAVVFAGVVVAVAPVSIHNLLSGDLVAISSNSGVNAFIGNNPDATGAFFLPPGSGLDAARLEETATLVAERAAGKRLAPSAVSSYWMARARGFVRAEPGRWIGLLGKKALLTINHYEIPNHLNFQFIADRFLRGLHWTLPFWILFPLSGLGGLAVLDTRSRPGWLVLAVVLLVLAVPILFFVTARYRLPAAPPMLILAGGGPAWLFAGIGRRRWVKTTGALLLLVALGWPARLELVREGDYSFDHLLLGDVYWKLGRLDEAIVELKVSIETAPVDHGARVWLAQVLEQRGNLVEAAAVLETHLVEQPEDLIAWTSLARLRSAGSRLPGPPVPSTPFETAKGFLGRGDLDDAERVLRLLIDREPTHVRAMIELAYVRTRFDDLLDAFHWLERAVRLAPSDPEIWRDLARIYHRAGHTEAARQAIERALALDPSDAELREVLDQLRED